MRTAIKCSCGSPYCKRWFVEPEARQYTPEGFTEDQARQVGHLLDVMDHEDSNPRVVQKPDIEDRIRNVLEAAMEQYRYGPIQPNTIVPVRSDLLTVALLEIGTLRNHTR